MRKLLLGFLLSLWASIASAGVPCTLPFNLQNNTIADATQVMANYNALVTCLGNAAAAGANSDITALFGLTTPLTNAQLANMAAQTVKCNPTGTAGNAVPRDCNFQCIIDGTVFPSTIAGIQAAINIAACQDIYIPTGTYSGTNTLTIARSNLRLHGAGGITTPQGVSSGVTASTILSFSCFSPGSSALVVGDASATLTYGGIDLSDFEILLPSACNMIGARIRTSTPDNGNMMRRVRVTEVVGNTVGTGIQLDSQVYSWRFEDVLVDHFLNGYFFTGQNHFTNIIGGQVRNNQIGFNHETATSGQSSNVVVSGVDIEGNTLYGFDIWSTAGFVIRDNFIDNGFSATTRAIRIGGGTAVPEGLMIISNYFNNGGTASYAIEIASNGFFGLNIIGNHFNNYATANVLNNGAAAASKKGVFIGNDQFGSVPETSSWQGFSIVDNAVANNFTVSQLPTCNFQMQGAKYFVVDQNTAVAYKGAVTGGGATGQSVMCNGSAWYQD